MAQASGSGPQDTNFCSFLLSRDANVGWLSGGFTPCRHLRPSSGREHTIVT